MAVAVRLLGSFEVEVDGTVAPPSAWGRRHAAALVKLLALAPGRRAHREQLLDALWPDLDPDEAAPRLHKAAHFARRATGAPDAIVVQGDTVCLFPGRPVAVDALELDRAAEAALADGSVEAAEAALGLHRGELLPEDLYEPWTDDLRERLRVRHLQLLRQAGRWADLVAIDPTDEDAHLALMRRHAQAGDRRAALQQFELLERAVRRELGVDPSPAAVALRDQVLDDLRSQEVVAPAEEGRITQEIRFCRTTDGVTLAYAVSGDGPPLVKAANWLTHLDHDWNSPVWRHWLVELSRCHRLVRYDERGCGLSDWAVDDWSLAAWVRDLEAVVDEAGLDRFPLLGISQGGAVAIEYAVRHPERVSHLVLYGSYAQGRRVRATCDEDRARMQLQVDLARLGWGTDDPAFRQVFTAQFMPGGSKELWDAFNDLQRLTASPENAARIMMTTDEIDITDLARQVRVPTLVLHARDDRRPPFEQGRLLATLIPGSRFVALDSSNHVLLEHEPAWQVFLTEVEAFLATEQAPTP
jgi:DNA-binding SARP family transcriptional activator/pimeloyl-ACP methyl ester carboxylesterase